MSFSSSGSLFGGLPEPVTPPSGAPKPRLTFIGCGYLGATYAICFAELGYEVLGVDIDTDKIAKLSAGEVPFHEPGLDELLRTGLATGRLHFATNYQQAADFGDVHFICVGTPQRGDGHGADLTYVEQAVTGLSQALHRKALIVGKSTVPAGTATWVQQLVTKHTNPTHHIEVAWSPEFLQEGHAVEDVLRPNRLVIAYHTPWAGAMLYAAHKGLFDLAAAEDREVPTVTCDFATAELVKVAANSFLATKISFINAISEICEVTGADITQLAKAIGHDPRIGNRYLQAGIGFGGGCLPKDIRAFQHRAQELGTGESLRLLHEVDLINQRRRRRILKLAAQLLDRPYGPAGPDLTGLHITCLGATFKPNTDDVRDAPALAVATLLANAGADVHIYDPAGMDNARTHLPQATYHPTLTSAITNTHLTCLLTEWAEFRNTNPHTLTHLPHTPLIIDGRNCLDPTLWTNAGWQYHGMGIPSPSRVEI